MSGVARAGEGLPGAFALSQNYPNPFNPTTVIRYALPSVSRVTLKVYNILGQEVKTLVNRDEEPGYRTVVWQGTNNAGNVVASGIYFYRIEANSLSGARFIETKKVVLLR